MAGITGPPGASLERPCRQPLGGRVGDLDEREPMGGHDLHARIAHPGGEHVHREAPLLPALPDRDDRSNQRSNHAVAEGIRDDFPDEGAVLVT